jgi:uncharacterized membrane protein
MHRLGAPGAAGVRIFGRTAPTVTKVNGRFRKSQVTCLLLAVLEGIDYWKANDIRYRRHKVQFRFWLITSLIVAFVAYSGAFGIQLLPAVDVHPTLADRDLGLAVLDDDGR